MKITKLHKVANAILKTKKGYFNLEWNGWADKWLNNEDRTAESARRAEKIAEYDYYELSNNQPSVWSSFFSDKKQIEYNKQQSILIDAMYASKKAIKVGLKMSEEEFNEADKWV